MSIVQCACVCVCVYVQQITHLPMSDRLSTWELSKKDHHKMLFPQAGNHSR